VPGINSLSEGLYAPIIIKGNFQIITGGYYYYP